MQTTILDYGQFNSYHRSSSDIEAEILVLSKLCHQIPSITAFGNSNRDALAAQLKVLRSGLTSKQVCELYDNDRFDHYVLTCALFASEWLYKGELAPSEDWLIMLYPDSAQQLVH
jgi:hypothetical protein